MAEFNLGTSLSADDYLGLVTAVNKRRNKSNAMLRGLGALTGVTPTMRTSSGFDTSLRAYSKAKDEEILSSIIGYAADHNFLDEDGMFNENMFRDWFTEQGLPDKMYEKSSAEFRKRAGRQESALASQAAQATAKYQEKIRPGQFTIQEQQIDKAKAAEMTESMSIVSANAARDDIKAIRAGADYDTVVRDRLEESYGWEKANKDYYSSIMAESGLKPGAAVQVYDTDEGELRFMRPAEIAKRNKEKAGTILPPGERPADVGDTGAMKALREKMRIISPVEKINFKEMNEDQKSQTRENYLTLTQLITSDQKQNVLLQTLTEGPLAKRLYEEIENIVKIEDPQFFQRTFGVTNAYELYAEFKAAIADREASPEKYFIIDEDGNKQLMTPEMMEEEFVIKGVQRTGWNPDHIYSLIKPNLYETGAKYKRYRLGG